jgi:16S rRNA processing protein RimM
MLVGRIGRPHGLDGSFHVTDPRPHLLTLGAELEGLGRIIARKGTDGAPILRIDVAADRTAIERLRGRELHVDDALAPQLGEDEYLAEQLEGCTVADGDRVLGVVQRLMALPSCEALELDTGLLVPLVRDAIRSIGRDPLDRRRRQAHRRRRGVPGCSLTSSRCSRSGSTGSAGSATWSTRSARATSCAR